MRFLISEIFRVYKKAPLQISAIWFLDLTESLIIVANPLMIGKCIDDLLQHKYTWLGIWIGLQIIFGISTTANKCLDTRIYSRIVSEESNSYYAYICKTEADNSLINARLSLVDDIPNFLEANVFQIFSTALGILASLFFLYHESRIFVFVLAIIFSLIIPISTYPYQSKITCNYEKAKSIEEKRISIISSRNPKVYKNFIQRILDIEIHNSDSEAVIFIITHLLQTILLIVAILSIVSITNFTIGLLYSTITYVDMLNAYVNDVSENIITLKNLKETVHRLKDFSH